MTTPTMLQQKMVPLGRLRADPANPRSMPERDMVKLKASLAEFGFVDPVVARPEDGTIIGGHQRVLALRALLLERGVGDIEAIEVPCVWVPGLTDERAKLLNLALNRIHGEWDFAKLGDLLEQLQAEAPDLLELSGFDVAEIDDILALMGEPEPPAAEGDPNDDIAKLGRRFIFDVADDAEKELCQRALRAFGMTSQVDAPRAFVAAMRAVLGARGDAQEAA